MTWLDYNELHRSSEAMAHAFAFAYGNLSVYCLPSRTHLMRIAFYSPAD